MKKKKINKKIAKKAVKKRVKKNKPLKKVSKKIEKVKTGIDKLDKLIQGGYKKNSINLLVGGSGSGKTIFATQFLMDGIKSGEKCLYITFEEKKGEFYSNMREFGWDLEELEKKGDFVFLEYTPEKVKTMLEEGGGIIENVVLRKKIKRIVIDSITSFALLFEEDLQKREAALSLFNMLRKWDITSLLTYEEDPSEEKGPSSKSMEFEADSIILLYFKRIKKQRERHLEILKMRGTKHSLTVHPISITNKGIKL